jgi:hypothetical protein
MKLTDYEAENEKVDAQIKAARGNPVAESPEVKALAETTPEETTEPLAEELTETPEMEAAEESVPKKRYDEAVKRMNAATQEAAELRKQLARSGQSTETSEGSTEEETTPETEVSGAIDDLELLKEDFPELARPIESLIKRLTAIEESHGKLASNFDKRYWNEINRAHPGLRESAGNDEKFAAWKAEQAPEILEQLHSGDHADVIAALNKFKADTGATSEAEKPPVAATVIDINVEKPKARSKMDMAKEEAAPEIPPSSGGKSEKPFKILSPDERAALSMSELEAYNEAWDKHLMKGGK